jgi:hypothetical protein
MPEAIPVLNIGKPGSVSNCVEDCPWSPQGELRGRNGWGRGRSGPVLFRCTDFRELNLSRCHQISMLAEAGYRCVAPGHRGYASN